MSHAIFLTSLQIRRRAIIMSQYSENMRRAKQSRLNRDAVNRNSIARMMQEADAIEKAEKAARKEAKKKR